MLRKTFLTYQEEKNLLKEYFRCLGDESIIDVPEYLCRRLNINKRRITEIIGYHELAIPDYVVSQISKIDHKVLELPEEIRENIKRSKSTEMSLENSAIIKYRLQKKFGTVKEVAKVLGKNNIYYELKVLNSDFLQELEQIGVDVSL